MPTKNTVRKSIPSLACEILKKTNDGDDLAPHHLKLLENAVNGLLNEKGVNLFKKLHKDVLDGYVKPWFLGVENFTQDLEGYVYYKGIQIEHYSHMTYDEALKELKELEKRCKHLEANGIRPTSATAIWGWSQKRK
jgi:hypothetical protein